MDLRPCKGNGPSGLERIRRRSFLGALASLPLSSCLLGAGDAIRPPTVIVVFASGVEAYLEAVGGLRAGLAKLVPAPLFIDSRSPQTEAELAEAMGSGTQRIVVTVGSEALTLAASRRTDALIVSTMILRSDRYRGALAAPSIQRPPAVYIDVPMASLLGELKNVLPGKTRCGLIRNAARDESDPSLPARAKQMGFALHAADCSRPEDLVKTFLSLKGQADFVVVLPDSSLYNNTTVRPLILASLENRLPIVGFSSSFVRAGAALGVYPDFHDIGAQTAEIVQNLIAQKSGSGDESPRKLQVAVNQRVLRLLGLQYNESPNVVIFR